MEQDYKIEFLEKKTTSTGKEKADVSLTGADGQTIQSATIWGDFPDFANLAPGSTVRGTLTPAKDPRFGPTLYPPRPQTTRGGASGASTAAKTKVIEKAMERKEESIQKFQASKEESIRLAGCQRDAVLLVQTMFGDNIWNDPILSEEEKRNILKKEVIKWRNWLYLSPEFNELPPFEN